MKLRLILTSCFAVVLALGACFDSLVNGACSAGYTSSEGVCVSHGANDAGDGALPDGSVVPDSGLADAGPDAIIVDARIADAVILDAVIGDALPVDALIVDAVPVDAMIVDAVPVDAVPVDAMIADAAPDAAVCTLPSLVCGGLCIDVSSDPDNCGGCGHVCGSGVCTAGVCGGALRGHIIAIGHDYRNHHAAMARVLGNSVTLGAHFDVGVARLHGTAAAAAQAGTGTAIASAMSAIGRPWHAVALPVTPIAAALDGVDVLVVDAQLGDGVAAEALGTSWQAAVTAFLVRGGIVVVLEGASGVSYRFAVGAGLYTVGAPIDATGQLATVVDATDVTTPQVLSPYLAEATSVTLPGTQPAVITAMTGGTVVFHLSR